MSELLSKVIEIVKEASSLATEAHISIKEKGNKDNIVTNADIAVEKYLKEKLTSLIPSGFLGEEGDDDRNHDYIWIVDPIDGTMNYARNLRQSAISVGLLHQDEIVLGVVYNPFLEELYYAEKGGGAYLNGERIHVSSQPFEEGLLCTAFSLYKKEYAEICEDIVKDVYKECSDFRRFGSCALELCYLASGRVDLYFEIRIFPWDYSGAEIILKEAGGILTAYDGNPLDHKKETVLIGANNLENHKRLVDIINRHLKESPF